MAFNSNTQGIPHTVRPKVSDSPYFNRALLVVALLLCVSGSLLLYRAFTSNPYPYWLNTVDFGAYIRGTRAIFQGHDPYIPAPCPCNEFYGTTEIHDQVAYPPFLFELLAPLVLIGDNVARISWLAISLAAIVATAAIVANILGYRLRLHYLLLILGITLVSKLGRSDLYHGQVNYFIMFIIALGLWLRANNKLTAAGVVLAGAIAIKPFLGILALYFLWKKDYKTAFVCLLTTAALIGLSFVPLVMSNGLTVIQSWRAASAYFASGDMTARPDNVSLNGLALRLFSDNLFTVPWANSVLFRIALEAVLLVVALIAFLRAVPRETTWGAPAEVGPRLFAEVSLMLGLTMALGPLTEGSHFLTLVAPAAVALAMGLRAQAHTSLWRWASIGWALFFVLLASPISLSVGLPSAATWIKPSGAQILLTGTIGMFLFGITLLCAAALGHERHLHMLA